MEEKQNFPRATGFSGKILIALLFILSGILLFARNMGWITSEVFDLIVSWHSLLILLGIYAMIRRHFIGGIILFLAGVYFLIGGLSWLPENSQAMVWPLALIIAGVLFIFKPGRNKRAQWARQHTMEHRRQWMKMHQGRPGMNFESEQQQSESVDGFLRSENVWGAARHVVLDELFKGAMIRTSFGGTTIDLAIPILHREKPILIWIAVGEESRFMSRRIGQSSSNAMLSLEDVMTNAGKMGM